MPQSEVPGEQLSLTQPFPTWPLAYEEQGLTEDDLIDFTPELRLDALGIIQNYRIGPIFNPPIQMGHPSGLRSFVSCPSGATNIPGPTSADPETGILYVSSNKGCRSERLVPGADIDEPDDIMTTGTTFSQYAVLDRGDFRGPQGLPIHKPPYGRITAIDMNTGEHLWWIPNGNTPERIRNHPALQGVDLPNTGQTLESHHDGHERRYSSLLRAAVVSRASMPWTRRPEERLATIDLPAAGQYGMMTYMYEGNQYIVVQTGGRTPAALVALRLPRVSKSY